MKLRRWFPLQQLLFACLLTAATAAIAQDSITTRDGKTQQTQILGVSGSSVQIKVGAGMVGMPLASITKVTKAPPPDYALGLAAYEAKDFPKALVNIKAVVDKYKGLPVDWAQQATGMLGDIYVALNRYAEAETAYKDFQKTYSAAGSVQADVGMARVAFSKKDLKTAQQRIAPILEQALKLKSIPKTVGPALSQAFYLSGQIKEADGNFTAALEDYLRTVTVFYQDRLAVNNAQERADALRKEHGVAVP